MTTDLLQDLTSYKSYRDKSVMMAARSLIHLFRELNPSMLKRKDRVSEIIILFGHRHYEHLLTIGCIRESLLSMPVVSRSRIMENWRHLSMFQALRYSMLYMYTRFNTSMIYYYILPCIGIGSTYLSIHIKMSSLSFCSWLTCLPVMQKKCRRLVKTVSTACISLF